ncbi:MAG: sigma-54-dependent Fis family transcriptional regulator [Verrucomicrobia bacterium]|nr:sigma-54-dependent Fis family transcriptional regulator [Verrucomicrobiota bacterium]
MSDTKIILIVDDEENTLRGLKQGLASAEGPSAYTILTADRADKAIEVLQQHSADGTPVDVMLTDLRMPGMNGLDLMRMGQKISPHTQTIMLTAYGTVENAVEAMKLGAFNYLMKPVNLDNLELLVKQAIEARELQSENVELRRRLEEKYGFEKILGGSAPMQRVFESIRQLAPTKANVLILGESGTGKELIANAIHANSPRSAGPFVPVHCAALAKTLLESELFGHERGAFTGAVASKPGRLERANGGTLFLDEISEIDLDIQVKLLRVLETWQFERVGGLKPIHVDVRLIAATNRDLGEQVKAGAFREDLYYRLNVVSITVPPLRERRDDIPILIEAFVAEFAAANRKKVSGIAPDALDALVAYDWPGNVRELRNVIESLIVLTRSPHITLDVLPAQFRTGPSAAGARGAASGSVLLPAGTSLQEAERLLIEEGLRKTGGNVSQAATLLGISRRTLHRKINEFGIRTERASS